MRGVISPLEFVIASSNVRLVRLCRMESHSEDNAVIIQCFLIVACDTGGIPNESEVVKI